MDEELKQFIIAIGAMVETLRLFREELLKNGFSRAEAMKLTEAFLREILSTATKHKEDN